MTFEEALTLIKKGARLNRSGWNGRGQSVAMVPETEERLAYIEAKTAFGQSVPWVASQSDLLAADWVVDV